MLRFGLILCIFVSTSYSLNVLFPLMCYGGHFGTVSTLFDAICSKHNCTLIETAQFCSKKVAPFSERLNLNVIKKFGLRNEIHINGQIDFLFQFCPRVMELMTFTYDIINEHLTENKGVYDIIITDQLFQGVIIAAEQHNVPVLVQIPGAPSGVENVQEKWFAGVVDSIIVKIIYKTCTDWIVEKRRSLGLPEMDYQGGFVCADYSSHFPLIVPTSPSIYPEPHSSVEHIYIGGIRDDSKLPKLKPDLEKWIIKDDLDIVYVSLGTHSLLDKDALKVFVDKLYTIKGYRVIWATSTGLQEMVQELGVFEKFEDKFYIGGFMPQFTLLKHDRIKIFVTHVGLGSLVDLIKSKKPGVYAPQFFDQFQNGKQMTKVNLGVYIESFDFETLDNAIQKVRDNYDFYKKNLIRVENEFAGYEKAELINGFLEKIAARKKTTVQYTLPFQLVSNTHHYGWKIFLFTLASIFVGLIALLYKCAAMIFRKFSPMKSKVQ